MIQKFVLTSLILLLLCGCQNSRTLNVDKDVEELMNIGYDEETSKLILNLSAGNQALYKREYNQKLCDLIHDIDFKEENINQYIHYNFDIDMLLYLVNNNIVNDSNYSFIKNCLLDKWFILDNLDLYLKYRNDFFNARDCIEYVNTKNYLPYYEEVIESDINDGIYILANKHYSLGNYIPNDLNYISEDYATSSHHMLKKEARDAFETMCLAAKQDGFGIYATSAYRSYSYQINLYKSYLEKDPQDVVDTYSSRAGFSDHQTALTVDILSGGNDFSNFEFSKEAKWLEENAHNFGFILRYPKGKESITGYIYEAWHFRYVGIDAATYIYENGITFDEYYAYFIEQQKS